MINFPENLFALSQEEEDLSKMIYDGKIIKCLVAPYHSYTQLGSIVPCTKTTYLFPEREMNILQCKALISMIVKSPITEEFRILTTNQNIIMDMIDGCVRVLTETEEIVPSPSKTFMANIHDIRHNLLENEAHQKSDVERNEGTKRIQSLLERIRAKSHTPAEWEQLKMEVELIGEPVIRNILKNEFDR